MMKSGLRRYAEVVYNHYYAIPANGASPYRARELLRRHHELLGIMYSEYIHTLAGKAYYDQHDLIEGYYKFLDSITIEQFLEWELDLLLTEHQMMTLWDGHTNEHK